MKHTSWVEIDRGALLHNVAAFRRLIGERIFAAVVKGDAYGHGMAEIATAIPDQVDWFAVNSLDEALGLRAAGCTRPILIMGATMPGRLDEVVAGGFRQVVFNAELVGALATAAERAGVRQPVHLEVETGTNRLGARPEDAVALAARIRTLPSLHLEGLYTHYANVEDTLDASYAEQQLTRFRTAVEQIEGAGTVPIRHSAASAAAILHPQTHFNLVRVGVSLYGLWPSAITEEAASLRGVGLELRPVLSWKTRIVHLNDVPMGETVGYGCTYYASQPRRIAVLPVGYYEGLDRGLSSRGPEPVFSVLVRDCPAPIVGRVSMNMTMVDVTRIPGVRVGDEVAIIGRQGSARATAEEMANALGTINYEVVTRIGASVPRVLV
jgi:alanine racemase